MSFILSFSVYDAPIDGATVVFIRAVRRKPVIPQGCHRHAQVIRRERVEDCGDRPEIIVSIIAQADVDN